MWASVPLLFAFLMVIEKSVDAADNGCNIEQYAEKVGCFKSKTESKQTILTDKLVNARNRKGKAYGGFLLNWFKWKQSINRILCLCVEKARKKGYDYVGLHYFGECLSGPNATYYASGGRSRNCLQELHATCNKTNKDHACMGGRRTNYIFKVKQANS